MRTLFLLFFLTAGSFVSAATDLSPLVDAQTMAVVRADLDRIDVQKIMMFFNDEIKETIQKRWSDKATAGKMLLVAQGGVAYAAATVQPIIQSLRNDGKVNEIFLIFDKKASDERMYPYFIAVPAEEEKPKAEIDAIRKLLLQNHCQITFQRHGFVIGIPATPGDAEKDEVKDFIKKRFAEPSGEKRPEFAEALESANSGVMAQLVIGNMSMFDQEFAQGPEFPTGEIPDDFPPEAKTFLEHGPKFAELFWKKMNFVTAILDGDKPEFKVEMRMNDEVAAREIYEPFEKLRKAFSWLVEWNSRFFLEYWYLDVFNRNFVAELSGKSITASIDAARYEALKKELVDTLEKLIPMLMEQE